VQFDGRPWTVGGLAGGVRVRLVDDAGDARVLLLAHVLASPGFELLEAGPPRARLDPVGLVDALPATVLERARQWERHVVEVQTGLPPDAPAGRPGGSPEVAGSDPCSPTSPAPVLPTRNHSPSTRNPGCNPRPPQ